MLKYILPAFMLMFSTTAFAEDVVPTCEEGMVWDVELGVCVEAPVMTPEDGDGMHKEVKEDMKTMDMDK